MLICLTDLMSIPIILLKFNRSVGEILFNILILDYRQKIKINKYQNKKRILGFIIAILTLGLVNIFNLFNKEKRLFQDKLSGVLLVRLGRKYDAEIAQRRKYKIITL